MGRAEIEKALYDTAEANGMTENVHARLMITRGIKAKPFQDPRLSKSGPTIVIIMEFSSPSEATLAKGIRLHTVPIYRGLPVTQDPKLNSHSKLNCILAGIHAQKAGADEALMLDPHGFVNTTNSCNFFIIRKGEVWTSSGDYCMNGITRKKVIELCRANGITDGGAQLLPRRDLRRRRSLHYRNIRRPDAGLRDRWQAYRRRPSGASDAAHPRTLQGAGGSGLRRLKRRHLEHVCFRRNRPAPILRKTDML